MQLVVTTLLVTVTFAAGFTLPGGFESDDNSPNKGMAVLIRKSAFRAFVITDAIAFTCSIGVIFSYFYMAINPCPMVYQDLGYLWSLSKVGARSQLVAMSAVVIAFVTGMYATLAHSVGLPVTVCAIGCIFFIMYMWAVLRPVCWIKVVKKLICKYKQVFLTYILRVIFCIHNINSSVAPLSFNV
ncbi:protein ACCELERATED CELL DEATH 6-like [Capsicum annuum]